MDLLAAATQGFQTVDADPAYRAKAVEFLARWLDGADFAAYRPQIEWQIQSGKWADLLDAFYQVLPFGTGGRRGAVGVGPNRMNLWTLGASVQGHCEYLKVRFPGKTDLHVALAYDVRQFEDKRKVYNPLLPNPVLHLSSKDFARFAAQVYAANGIQAHILPPESPRFLATPELSFAIRFLKAHGGLNISASHNPPDDNGGKFYDERGGQPVPPDDQIMSDLVDQVVDIRSIPWADAVRAGKIHFLDDSSHKAYIELCRKQSVTSPAGPRRDSHCVHAAARRRLHDGDGGPSSCGLQADPRAGADDARRPVPERDQVAEPGSEGKPRSSREGCSRKQGRTSRSQPIPMPIASAAWRVGTRTATGEYRFLTGNDICALITHFKLTQLAKSGRMPASPIVVTTEVTTSLVGRIARQFNAQIVENLLVGFKYIAEVIWQLESTGQYEDVSGTPADFVLGCEESHGLQTTAELRDKDAGRSRCAAPPRWHSNSAGKDERFRITSMPSPGSSATSATRWSTS